MEQRTHTRRTDGQTVALFLPSLRGGGAERMMVNLANGLAASGARVDLVLAHREGEYFHEVSTHVRIVNLRKRRILWTLLPLVHYLRSRKPMALIATLDHANIIAVCAALLTGRHTMAIVRVANTLSESLQGSAWHKRVLRKYGAMLFYRFADAVVANSHASADDLARVLHIPRACIRVIYNPTVTADITNRSKEPVTHSWLTRAGDPVILAVGRLHPQKDYPTLIRAFARVRETLPARLLILGAVARGHEALRADLERLADELGVRDHVDFHGFVKNPYAYMARADVYVLSSRWEGLPNTLIEAMAVGTPVVSTDCPSGPAEILDGGAYGALVPVGDADALARAIVATLEDPPESRTLQDRAGLFSAERAVRAYRALIAKHT